IVASLWPRSALGLGSIQVARLALADFVLQREIAVAGGMPAAEARNLAAHAHIAVSVLDRAPERRRELGDGEFHKIEARRFAHALLVCCGPLAPCYTSAAIPAARAIHEPAFARVRRARARARLEDRR